MPEAEIIFNSSGHAWTTWQEQAAQSIETEGFMRSLGQG
jgi:hypothetical protein